MTEQLLTGGASAAFLSMVFGFVKLIQWWIKEKKSGPSVVIENNQPVPSTSLQGMQTLPFPHQQEEELHTVYLYLTEQKIQFDYLRLDIRAIKETQDTLCGKMSELVSTTQRLMDRISDLITVLSHTQQKD